MALNCTSLCVHKQAPWVWQIQNPPYGRFQENLVEGNPQVIVVRKLLPWDRLPLRSLVFQRLKEFGTKTKSLEFNVVAKRYLPTQTSTLMQVVLRKANCLHHLKLVVSNLVALHVAATIVQKNIYQRKTKKQKNENYNLLHSNKNQLHLQVGK